MTGSFSALALDSGLLSGNIKSTLLNLTFEERIFGITQLIFSLHLAVVSISGNNFMGIVTPLMQLAAIAVLFALFAAFKVGGRSVRMLLSAAVGVVAVFSGISTGILHAIITGIGASDVTGILLAAVGVASMALAFSIGLRNIRRAVKVVLALAFIFIIFQWVMVPAVNAGIATNAPRLMAAPAGTLGINGATDISFLADDGIMLSGWYIPGENGAAVIVLHGSLGTRADTVDYIRMLSDSGYAVLSYDARGHGASGGRTNALGWSGAGDLASAVAFLKNQDGVDPGRIAALGLSMGGEVSLRAAASGVPLLAVIADGAGASTQGDSAAIEGGPLAPVALSVDWLGMRAIELLSGNSEPAPLLSVVSEIEVPVMLIASSHEGELTLGELFRARIGTNSSIWYIDDVGHVGGFAAHPDEYAERVTSFLETAIG